MTKFADLVEDLQGGSEILSARVVPGNGAAPMFAAHMILDTERGAKEYVLSLVPTEMGEFVEESEG